jgi:bifunctional non-homologous end joining protein LigD
MLATLVDEVPPDEANWVYEIKYDGFRAIGAVVGGELALWSRNELDLQPRFPKVASAVKKLRAAEFVIDGEIVALDDEGAHRFQLLQQGNSREVIFVFDLLWLEGRDLRKLPYESRRELLERFLVRAPAGIRLAEQIPGPGRKALARVAGEGFEGLIAKRCNSIYEGRRSKQWLKIKAVNEQELAIVGYNPSTHSNREVGSLHLAVAESGELVYAGKVGTGFSEKQRVWLKDELSKDVIPRTPVKNAPRVKVATWVKPRLVAQVHFTEWTSDGRLRHPAFLGLRPDKKPMECARERPQQVTKGKATVPSKKSASKRKLSKSPGSAGVPPAVVGHPARRPGIAKNSKTTSARSAGTGRGGEKLRATLRSTKKSTGSAPTVALTNPDRVLYPRDKFTKQTIADYYAAVAEPMIRALRNRPLALEHWNQGIDKPSWFQQDISARTEPWVHLIETRLRTSNRSVKHFSVDRPEALQWLAQHSVLTAHMWSSREESLETPDWIVFDLDPAKGKGIEQAVDAALVLRGLLEHLDLPSVPKTSGKRGIHLFVPIAPKYSHEEATDFACALGAAVARQVPDVTMERSIASRRGRLYLDCLQNGYGKTVVAPYSPRAIDGAPVSAPLLWSEISKKLDPLKFNIRTMPNRLAKLGDLFEPATKKGVKLPVLK